MENYRQFAATWKARRLKAEITQKTIASKVGVHEFTFSRWETGKLNPNVQHVIAVEDYLRSVKQGNKDFKKIRRALKTIYGV